MGYRPDAANKNFAKKTHFYWLAAHIKQIFAETSASLTLASYIIHFLNSRSTARSFESDTIDSNLQEQSFLKYFTTVLICLSDNLSFHAGMRGDLLILIPPFRMTLLSCLSVLVDI